MQEFSIKDWLAGYPNVWGYFSLFIHDYLAAQSQVPGQFAPPGGSKHLLGPHLQTQEPLDP